MMITPAKKAFGFLVILFLGVLVFSVFEKENQDVYAASTPLSCTITSGTCSGVIILNLQALTNSHAELNSESNYSYKVCCQGTNIGNSCTGTHAVALKLSATTNAHVEENGQSNYSNNACISYSPTGGSITCAYANSCATLGSDYVCLASISGATNAHIGDCSAYTTKVCCKTGAPPPPPLPKWRETNPY